MNKARIALVMAVLVCLAACEKSASVSAPAAQADGGTGPVAVDATAPASTGIPENSPEVFSGDFLSGDIVETEMCAVRMNDIALSKTPTRVDDKTRVAIHGWFGDEQTMAWPAGAMLYIQQEDGLAGVWSVALTDPKPRGDVARKFNSETMRNTGFEVMKNLAGLPSGDYRLVLGFEKNGKQHRCDRNRLVRLP